MPAGSATPGAAEPSGINMDTPAVQDEPVMKYQPEDRPERARTLDMQQRDRIRDDIVEVMEKTRDALAKALKKPAHRVMSENQIAKLGQTVDRVNWGDTVDDLYHIFPADKVREIGAPVLAAYRSFRAQHPLLSDVPADLSAEEKAALTGGNSDADSESEGAAANSKKKKPAAKKSAAKPTPKPKKAAATPKPKPAPKAKKSAAKKVVGSKRTRAARSEDDDEDEETTDSSELSESSSEEEAPKPRRGVKAKPKPAPKAKRTVGSKAKRQLVFDEETSPDEQSSAEEDDDASAEENDSSDEGSSEEDEETSSSEEEDDDSDDSEIARRKRAAKKKKVIELDESDEDTGNRRSGRGTGPRRTWNPADRLNDGSRAPKPKPSHVKVKGGEIKPSTKTAFKVKFGSENVPPARLLSDLAAEREKLVRQQNKELDDSIIDEGRAYVDGNNKEVLEFTTTCCWDSVASWKGPNSFASMKVQYDMPEMMKGAHMPSWVEENKVRSAIFFAAMLRHRCPHCKDLPMASPVSNAYETLALNATAIIADLENVSTTVREARMDAIAKIFSHGGLQGMGHRRQSYYYHMFDSDSDDGGDPSSSGWEYKRKIAQKSVATMEGYMQQLFPMKAECSPNCRHKDIYTLIDNFAGLTSNAMKLPISVLIDRKKMIGIRSVSVLARSILTTIPKSPESAQNVASRRQAMQAFLNLVADEGQEPQGTDAYGTDNYPMAPEDTITNLQEDTEGCGNHKELLAMCSIEDTGTDGVLPKADTPAGIALQLKPHQQEGVHFMISREATGTRDYVTVDATKVGKYRFYYSPITLRLVMIDMAKVADEQAMQRLGKKLNPTVRGGILADMMGLGKTLQVFSLMAANPINPAEVTRPLRLPTPESPVKIKATLVVAPVSICRQWMTELKKCFPDAKALLYHGQTRFNFTLEDLAEADMIVTTYETLDKELQGEVAGQHSFGVISAARGKYTKDALARATAVYLKGPVRTQCYTSEGQPIMMGSNDYPQQEISRKDITRNVRLANVNDEDERTFQGPDIYDFFDALVKDVAQSSSPSYKPYRLRDIIFHRVLLDECQKCAGGSFSNLKELQSTYRWVVTGTPINNRYVALAPLFEFLGSSYPRRVFDQDDFARMRYTDSSKIYTPDLSFYLSERRVFADYDNDDYHSGSRPSTTYNNQTLSHRCKLTRYAKPPRWIIAFILQRYMIRHANYSEIMSQVPPVTKVPVYVTMTEVERECYTKIFTRVKDDINTLTRQGRIGDRIGRILMWVDQVRRAAIHPSILLAESLASATANYNASSGTTNENERYNIKQIEAAELKRDLEARNPPAPEACLGSIRRMNGQPPEVDECAVCMQSMVDPVMLPCTHFICRECLLGVIKVKPECPHCRARNMDTKLKYQILLDTSAVELGGQSVQYWQDLIARASEGSKMRAVLNIIGRGSEDDKYVIFSTFPSFIGKMCEALRGHRVNVEVIDGSTTLLRRGKIIEQFQSSDELQPLPSNRDRGPLRVLIISSRCGNAGLTLTAANHLILVEPSLNTTIEDQAMGRLHRIGQHRPVTIHRLVTRHTIEAKIYELSVAGKLVSQGNGGSIATRGENNNSSAAVAQIMEMFNGADDDEEDA